jgi:hypothetical protein
MKRTALSLVLILALAGLLSAQTVKKNAPAAAPAASAAPASAASAAGTRIAVPAGAIRLENDSANLVFYTVLGMKSADLNQLLSQPQAVLEKVRNPASPLSYLPARTVMPAITVGDTEQLVLGYSLVPSASAWQLWYLRVPTKGLRPSPAVFSVSLARGLTDAAGQALSLSTVDYNPPAMPIRVDGRFIDWLKYDDVLSWSERNPPSAIVRQEGSVAARLNLGQSQFWAKGGTDLEHFRAIRSGGELLVMVSARSLMTKGLSYLLRFYEPVAGAPSRNRFLLEIPVDAATGPVLAWEDGKADPRVAGDFATADYYLEARFRLSDLPAGLPPLLGKECQVEVAATYSQPGQSEEFTYGRFPSAAISAAK